ncbi:MAG: para-aminobenzoate synthase component [Bacilli bacterium]|nr:para-aminobenzoate synthase component [Bacilli bacterium]
MMLKQLYSYPIESALNAVELLECLPCDYRFLLESSSSAQTLCAEYSFLGAEPYRIVSGRQDQILVDDMGHICRSEGSALDRLTEFINAERVEHRADLPPFQTGAVGFFSYDLGRQFEVLPEAAVDDLEMPDLHFAFYNVVIAIHEQTQTITLLAAAGEGEAELVLAKAARWLTQIELAASAKASQDDSLARPTLQSQQQEQLHSNFTREQYIQTVAKAIDYIYAGDIFQVNLSQRFQGCWRDSPVALYKEVRHINPAPFSAFLDCGVFSVVSSSPERFLSWGSDQGKCKIETRPIKGTRPRGQTADENRRMREDLWASEKDQAELAMIVDLLRNDLGRICEYGSVRVPDRRRIEEYATVLHTVATIEGSLRPDCRLSDIIKATFPGGSITGAPKIRAMEIIEELEPVRRGIYCGSIGYLGLNGTADLNVAIRTFLVREQQVYFHAGGGIVADSDPDAEYEETLHKASGLMQSLGIARLEG